MKIMNIFRLLVIFVMAIVLQQTVIAAETSKTDSVTKKEYDELNQKISAVTFDSEDAKSALSQIYESYWNGSMNLMDAVKKIKTEVSRIVTSKQDLKKTMEKAIEAVKEGSYWNSFLSGARNLAARIAAPFKSGYGYTEDEKEIAREMIKEFEGPKETLTTQYNDKLKKLNKNILEKNILTERYDAIINQLDNEIYQQQLITGDAMSTQRKLFWATVATGAAVAGATLLASRGSADMIPMPTAEPQLTSTPEIVLEPTSVISGGIMEQGSALAPVTVPMTEQIPLIAETPQQIIQASEPEISSLPAETIMPAEMPIIEEPVVMVNEPTQVEFQESNLDELTSAPEIVAESIPVVSELEESAPEILTEQELAAPMIEQASSITEETPQTEETLQETLQAIESDLSSIPQETPTIEETPIEETPITKEVSTTEEMPMPVAEEQVVSEVRNETEDKPTQIETEEGSLNEVSGEIQKEENLQAIGSTEEIATRSEEPVADGQNVALQEIQNELENYRDKSKIFWNEVIAQGGEEGGVEDEVAKEILDDLDAAYKRSLSHYTEEIKEGRDPQEILNYLQISQAKLDKAREHLNSKDNDAAQITGSIVEQRSDIKEESMSDKEPLVAEDAPQTTDSEI